MSCNSGPPAKRLRSDPYLSHKQSISTPLQTAFPFNQPQLTSAPAQSKVKIEDADTQDSESPRAGTGQPGVHPAASKDADAGTLTQNGATHDGAPQGRAPATEESQTLSPTPVELRPEWKAAMACASVHLNWPPNHLESAYAEVVSEKGDDITAFYHTRVQGPYDDETYARVTCLRGNPGSIASVSIARADALPTMRVTRTSVEHVVVRGSKSCPLWLAMDSGGYLKPCCDEWYACFDFKNSNTQHEIHAFLVWVLEKEPAKSLADYGVSYKDQAMLWRDVFKYKHKFEKGRRRLRHAP